MVGLGLGGCGKGCSAQCLPYCPLPLWSGAGNHLASHLLTCQNSAPEFIAPMPDPLHVWRMQEAALPE